MGQREEEIGRVALLEHALVHHGVGDGPVVGVREQAALGGTRGARGVDVQADVVRGDGLVAGRPLGLVARAAALAQRLERDLVVAQVGTGGVDDDDVTKLGALVADRAQLGQLLGVLGEHGPRVRVVEHVLALLGRVRLVDRDEGGAGGEDAEAGVRPLRTGVGEYRDLLAGLNSEVDEAQGDLAHRPAEVGVGDVDPLLAHLVALRRPVGVLLGRQRQQIGDRLRARAFCCGPGGHCFHSSSPPGCDVWPRSQSAAPPILWGEGRRGHPWPRASTRPWPAPSSAAPP